MKILTIMLAIFIFMALGVNSVIAKNCPQKNDKKLKVMVTGHKGYVGSRFVEKYKDKYDIVGYDILDGDDILDYDNLKNKMKGVDIVVHEAAIPGPIVGKTYEDYVKTNVAGTFNVLKAANENKVKRVVYASSTTIYGIEKGIPFSYPITEGQKFVSQYLKADDLHCRDIDLSYHTSKVIAEQMVAWYGLNKKFQTIALRYGPIDKEMTGAHVSIDNVLQATQLAVDSDREFWYEAFSIVDPDVKFIDISKARKMLGYNPKKAKYTKEQVIEPFETRLKLGDVSNNIGYTKKYTNADYYKNGVFQKDVAMDAIEDMLRFYGEDFTPEMKHNIQISDYGLGDFEHVGLSCVFWINSPKSGYFAQTMYLLPGQMIPEHKHIAIKQEPQKAAKDESWKILHGWAYNFSEIGKVTPNAPKIPQNYGNVISKNFAVQKKGDVLSLKKVETRHFLMAGEQGAIIDEYGSNHDRRGQRFSNTNITSF